MQTTMRFRTCVALALVALVASLSTVAAAQEPGSPEQVALAFVEARNTGDAAGAVALVAEGGTFQGAGGCVQEACSGHRLQEQMQRETAINIRVTVLETEVDGNTVRFNVQATNDRIRQCGVERVLSTETYTVVDGKITSVVVAINRADEQSAKFLACPPATAPAAPSTGSGLASTEHGSPSWIAFAVVATIVSAWLAAVQVRRRRAAP